jgi:hypothetical protein
MFLKKIITLAGYLLSIVRIRKDPKPFLGSRSGTRGYGSGSGFRSRTGLEPKIINKIRLAI